MTVKRPYYLTIRQFKDGDYSEGGRSRFVEHKAYSTDPSSYTRPFMLIQKDIVSLFEYVEPAQQNLATYSLRTFELLLRTCTEVEANLKAIIRANNYSVPERRWDITHYYKVQLSHFLSDYQIKLPYWKGYGQIRKPFSQWTNSYQTLDWYDAYNKSKHDRVLNLHKANLENLIDAFSALATLLAAQYYIYDFTPNNDYLTVEDTDEFEGGIGGYLRIAFPSKVPISKRYEFDWATLEDNPDPFVKLDYDSL
jgi:hypothetical protein